MEEEISVGCWRELQQQQVFSVCPVSSPAVSLDLRFARRARRTNEEVIGSTSNSDYLQLNLFRL
jgi:hypothetical protein